MLTNDKIIENNTCFNLHEEYNLPCLKKECRCWFNNLKNLNCINILTSKGPQKQEQIGEYFGLTRMRVCQIEKAILFKIRKNNKLGEYY